MLISQAVKYARVGGGARIVTVDGWIDANNGVPSIHGHFAVFFISFRHSLADFQGHT
jgi:hypothetical protein